MIVKIWFKSDEKLLWGWHENNTIIWRWINSRDEIKIPVSFNIKIQKIWTVRTVRTIRTFVLSSVDPDCPGQIHAWNKIRTTNLAEF